MLLVILQHYSRLRWDEVNSNGITSNGMFVRHEQLSIIHYSIWNKEQSEETLWWEDEAKRGMSVAVANGTLEMVHRLDRNSGHFSVLRNRWKLKSISSEYDDGFDIDRKSFVEGAWWRCSAVKLSQQSRKWKKFFGCLNVPEMRDFSSSNIDAVLPLHKINRKLIRLWWMSNDFREIYLFEEIHLRSPEFAGSTGLLLIKEHREFVQEPWISAIKSNIKHYNN